MSVVVKVNFSDKEEALQEAIIRLDEYKPYCPLINGDCDHNCICFKKIEVYADGSHADAKWFIRGGCCGNKMLCGG